jgi:hypothetical protein
MDSPNPCSYMMMRKKATKGNLQLSMDSEPQWGPCIPHIHKMSFLSGESKGKDTWKSMH